MIRALFAATPEAWPRWRPALEAAFAEAGLAVALARDHPPETVDYILYTANGPVADFASYRRAKAVLNLWAGVEGVVDNPSLHIPLTRMVDEGLTEGMVEWASGHVLRHHLGMDRHLSGQDGVWRSEPPPLARARGVGVLGLGALGRAVAGALAALNFRVAGWSRTARDIPGLACASGAEGLARTLASSEILVTLLPLTPATDTLLDAAALARLPQGAVLVNPGRGALVDDAALIAALDAGRLSHATLDVFREEPLPADHPFWAHPKVTVTPHIASTTRPETAARVVAENIRRGEAGEPFLHRVNPGRGY